MCIRDSPITVDVTEGFKTGVTLADGEKMLPAEIIPLADNLKAKIILHQGVYHQIKRLSLIHISCGACVYSCPWGAIMDKSYILDVIEMIRCV